MRLVVVFQSNFPTYGVHCPIGVIVLVGSNPIVGSWQRGCCPGEQTRRTSG